MDVSYSPRYAVIASWSLEFFPANISVVFFQQAGGNRVNCIGSQSWMFPTLAECIADLGVFPWKTTKHLIGIEWVESFAEQRVFNTECVILPPTPRPIQLAQSLLSRCQIDTAPRPWEPAGNNQILLDSLADYRLPERGENEGRDYGLTPVATFEQYLTRGVEIYAVWESRPGSGEWHPGPNYDQHDRAAEVIPRDRHHRR